MTKTAEMGDFGKQLRHLRVRLGLTQSDLAEASSLGQSTISALETGHQSPWPSTRRALAHAFHMTLEEFDAEITGRVLPPLSGGPGAPGHSPLTARTALVELARGTGPTPDFPYAPAKVMELLNELGQAEQQLSQYRTMLENVFAACWTTDATLHLTGALGPVAAEQRNRYGDFASRHLTDFFEVAWHESSPDFVPLSMHQRAADGESVSFSWQLGGRRYTVYVDPVTDDAGQVVGTVGLAIDVTDRQHVGLEPPSG